MDSWLQKNGYEQSVLKRYGEWLGVAKGWVYEEDGVTKGRCIKSGVAAADAPARCGVLQGDWGTSNVFKRPASAGHLDRALA